MHALGVACVQTCLFSRYPIVVRMLCYVHTFVVGGHDIIPRRSVARNPVLDRGRGGSSLGLKAQESCQGESTQCVLAHTSAVPPTCTAIAVYLALGVAVCSCRSRLVKHTLARRSCVHARLSPGLDHPGVVLVSGPGNPNPDLHRPNCSLHF